MPVLADSLPSLSTIFMDNLKPAIYALTPVFGLKLAINLGPTVFKRICQESYHHQLSPIMMPIPEDEREYSDEHLTFESDYYVECQVCHTDMTDEVYFERFDDSDLSKHICYHCATTYQDIEDHFEEDDQMLFCEHCGAYLPDLDVDERFEHYDAHCLLISEDKELR